MLINELNLDIKLVNVRQENSEEFVKKFPLKKIPAFVGSDGYEVHETLAIIYYCMFYRFLSFLNPVLTSSHSCHSFQDS